MSDPDKFIQRLVDVGTELLIDEHGDNLVWAERLYRFHCGDEEPLHALFRDAPVIPPFARALLYDILRGERKPKKRKAKRAYTPEAAWQAAWLMISVRRTHDLARAGVHEIADQVAVDPSEMRAKVNAINKYVAKVGGDRLGVGERTMDNIFAEVEKILKELPQTEE